MGTFIVAILSIAISSIAQFCLKAGMTASKLADENNAIDYRFVLLGFALYGGGAVVWLRVLSVWDVSKAYPLVGLGFVFAIAGGFMTGEQPSLQRILGVLLICLGVIVVAKS